MLKELTAFGNKPLDDRELSHVRSLLKADPNLWRTLGDVATWSRKHCLSIVPERTVQHECVHSGMSHMRTELLKDGDSELERIVIEQIITCWLQVGTTSYLLQSLDPTAENLDQIKRLERRYNHDQARLTRSLTLLNRIRRTILDTEVKKYNNQSFSGTFFEWERRIAADTQDSPANDANLDHDAQSSEAENRATPIPKSTAIPTVFPQIENFIRQSLEKHDLNVDPRSPTQGHESREPRKTMLQK